MDMVATLVPSGGVLAGLALGNGRDGDFPRILLLLLPGGGDGDGDGVRRSYNDIENDDNHFIVASNGYAEANGINKEPKVHGIALRNGAHNTI
jgi:hypothetical protein